jgi:hypothetical protein
MLELPMYSTCGEVEQENTDCFDISGLRRRAEALPWDPACSDACAFYLLLYAVSKIVV